MRQIQIPEIYYSHQREVFERDGMLLSAGECNPLRDRRDASRSVRYVSAPSAT
ncbi:MAG: hypothetical protein WKF83_10350 [Nocardioidaceae bacterium]